MQTITTIDLNGVNSYLVKNEDNYMLVDTGGHLYMDKEYTNRRELLAAALQKNGVTKDNLKLILLTHGDNDHVCNADYFCKLYSAPIAMHGADAWMVNKPQKDSYKINSHYESRLLTFGFHLLNGKIEKLMQKVYQEFEPFEPDILLNEGDTLDQYGFDATIYHTPGHTKGSIALLDSQGNLIVGDTLACNKKPSIAVNAEDFEETKKQAKRLLALNVKTIYPGHGTVFSANQIKNM